jgi:hypothetical protein
MSFRFASSQLLGKAAPTLAAAIILPTLAMLPACTLAGAMAESYRRTSTRPIEAEYQGLAGKSFAVLVATDRGIQAEHPQLLEFLAVKITERLSNPTNQPTAGGFVAAQQVLQYQYRNPTWAAKPMSEIAKELGGVDRIILVEVTEYRLHEPGNSYEWQGNATFTTNVFETDSEGGDEIAFSKTQSVDFPDQKGVAADTMDRRVITTALASRTIDRSSWLFYKHEEPYYPDY